ncbi:patatin-like phospholipase family protein [Enterococcus sp. BWT-B8]|uniref:patatin-like phospholipase family protein n=1 Tax=Enterococcus sp. BWT-B8 TaxID=2885157 RepID=UPI001E655B90|nr:patatin-like phospholipase family protein [Enterococcus sp. BWT-B8]MCB5951192.1 patatin-like phospholipase family protein [Enterococcus sp. BWT-B8]
MNVLKLVPSDKYDIASAIQVSTLPLPFYKEHSAAHQQFLEQLEIMEADHYVVLKNSQPVLFATISGESIVNLMTRDISWMNWKLIFDGLELIGKTRFQSEIRMTFAQPLSHMEQAVLEKHEYIFTDDGTASRKLHYHTALVLGGGGARGAYQIGVWQALKELEIPFELITGTSVGALNGALIIQDDFERAKEMWEKIETKKILSFPMKVLSKNTLSELLGQIASFTLAAIQSKGVSTQPLQQLLDDTFSEEKLKSAKQEFYIVTTELPGVTERVIHFNSCKNNQQKQWLLASSSFFPAMAAAVIDEKFYIDGGYRNNVPIDVAFQNGATEYIVADVKGPGFSKRTELPDSQPKIVLKTPWTLGNVLLFDGIRSKVNIQLGYLETMKAFQKYSGYWYTFDEDLKKAVSIQKSFFRYIKKNYSLSLWKNGESRKRIYQKLRRYYKDRVYEENISLVLLELLGKQRDIPPNKLYTVTEFIQLLEKDGEESLPENSFDGMISVQEWLGRYYDEFFLLSDKRQFQLMTNFLNVEAEEKQRRLSVLFERLPAMVLEVLMNEYIQKGRR